MLKLVLILRCRHPYIVLIFSFTNLNPCKFMGPKRGLLFDEGINMKKSSFRCCWELQCNNIWPNYALILIKLTFLIVQTLTSGPLQGPLRDQSFVLEYSLDSNC